MSATPFLKRYGVMIALVVIALICYAVGYKKGSTLAIILGVIFEGGFWFKLIRDDRAKRSPDE
jgi:hypothetical protein